MSQRTGVVVAAAGLGRRMGVVRKQYQELLGTPVLVWALRPFLEHPAVGAVVVALPEADLDDPPAWLSGLDRRISLVAGGSERGDSVRLALDALPSAADVVLVHDAARPLLTGALVDRVLRAASAGTGAVPGLPVTDTIKQVDEHDVVLATPDRNRLRSVQTPQGFPRTLLVGAYRRAREEGVSATDDAALVERYGGRVVVVPGEPENLKVTTPHDFAVAEAILRGRVG